MIELDEDALICDFAETYHIYDFRGLSPIRAGVLACGLRDDSRIKMKMMGMKVPFDDMLLATIADKLENQLYQYAKAHGASSLGEPVSIVQQLNNSPSDNKEFRTFTSGDDFMKEWNNAGN